MNTPAVMQHLGGVQTTEGWRAAYSRIVAFQREFGHTFWIVEDRSSGEILGFCGLKRVNSPGAAMELTGMPEIGWRLRESAWGKGIAKEAAIRCARSRVRAASALTGDCHDHSGQSRQLWTDAPARHEAVRGARISPTQGSGRKPIPHRLCN